MSADDALQIDAQQLARRLVETHTGRMLAVHQQLVVSLNSCVLALRVCSADMLPRGERAEKIGYHSYRGRLVPDTEVFLRSADLPTGVAGANRGHILALQGGSLMVCSASQCLVRLIRAAGTVMVLDKLAAAFMCR